MLFLMTLVMAASGLAQPTGDWQETIDRVVPAVVALRVNAPRAFDTESPGYLQATGFVVDAERGLILTNRHVVRSGPVVAEAVLLDHEEVPVEAVYRDPVHDFGFYRFDPEAVEFMELPQLELAPESARVGREIRVIGNDAGEKLSILPGTIARLDRRAPDYGPSAWNDFNTFYIQAASGTSGGSSGSPVVDINGQVVALNAGGSMGAASSFFLPLDRVQRALAKLQDGELVERGTLQTVFVYETYDEVRRLGVRRETEAAARKVFPDSTGMLVVGQVVPGGPAAGMLEPGDVVVGLNGKRLGAFIPLEAVLDDSVGDKVTLDIERGGELMRVELEVGDLHAITPDTYLEFGGAILNPLSYHQARNHSIPVEGVYLANPGYTFSRAGFPPGVVVTHVGGVPTPELERFESEMARYADGEKVTVRFFSLENPRTPGVLVVRSDRRWFPMQTCSRDDATGRWPCNASPAPRAGTPPEPGSTDMVVQGSRAVRAISPSLVLVEYDVPFRLDGVHGERFSGAGLVVDAEAGLVVVDRETVPIALGDLSLVFGGSVELAGELVYLHPEHNFAVIRYEPSLLHETEVRSAVLSDEELAPGDPVWLVGITGGHRIVSRHTRVSRREPISMPLTFPPRFRERNVEVVTLEDSMPTVGGVLVDDEGRVQGLWSSFSAGEGLGAGDSFFAGLPVRQIRRVVDPLREGNPVGWRSLGIEFFPLTLSQARGRGLSDEQARQLEAQDPEGRRVLVVRRLEAGTPSSELLRSGDLLLSVNGRPVTRHYDIEQAAMHEQVELRVLRDGEVLDLSVPTKPLTGTGTDRALLWAGTLLQDAPDALAREYGIPPEGVYVARYWFGSPANRYGLMATVRIVEVDGIPTPDLNAFVEVVKKHVDRDSVRLKTIDLDGRMAAPTLKLDLEYWPTTELRRTPAGWHTRHLNPATSRISSRLLKQTENVSDQPLEH